MVEVTRHFTATTFVVHDGRVLLHKHQKQGLWLPPGGHIERDELPDAAARREIEEETGLRLRLHSEDEAVSLSREMACGVVPQPAFILIEDINPYHQHVDFTYFAELAGDPDLTDCSKHNGFAWFTLDELDREGVPQNVKAGAHRAIEYFRARQAAKSPPLPDPDLSGAASLRQRSCLCGPFEGSPEGPGLHEVGCVRPAEEGPSYGRSGI